jgi:hypothetical protein
MRLGLLTLVGMLAAATSYSQFTVSPFEAKRSELVSQIKALKVTEPGIKPDDLARRSNELLTKTGLGFTINVEPQACAQIKTLMDAQRAAKKTGHLVLKLPSIGGDAAPIVLPDPQFPSSSCKTCSIELPLLELTESNFVMLLMGQNIKFAKPAWMIPASVELEQNVSAATPLRWNVPLAGEPIGITEDETVIYLALPDPDLMDLAVAVFREGVFEITTREEATGKSKRIELPPLPDGRMRAEFDRGKQRSVVIYRQPCN